jgi:GcrA cell cycle regulator
MSWTTERISTLSKLWLEGLSASAIARQLGGVSRNAVIGKVHRLGLSGRCAMPTTPGAARKVQARPRPAPKPRPTRGEGPIRTMPTAPRPVVTLPTVGLATRTSVGARVCRWPIGDPLSDSFRDCGRPVATGSYCPGCAVLAYQPPSARRRTERRLEEALARYT